MTEPSPAPTARPKPAGDRGHAASGARIVVAGLAAGSALGLVGAMSAAARSSTPAAGGEPVRRVVVVDRTTGAAALEPGSAPSADTAEPAPLPLPPLPDAQPSEPVTQSEGS